MPRLLPAIKRALVQLAVIVPLFVIRAHLPLPLKHVFDRVLAALFVLQAVVGGIRGVKEHRNQKMVAAGIALFALGTITWIWGTELAGTHDDFVVEIAVAMCVAGAMVLDMNERRNAA